MLVEQRQAVVALLLEVPGHVDRYAEHDHVGYVERTVSWLAAVEATAARFQLPLASQAAGARARVLAVQDGLAPSDLDGGVRPNRRKTARAQAAVAISEVEAAARGHVSRIDETLEEAKEKIAQLLAITSTKAPIPLPPTEPRRLWLQQVWDLLGGNGETRNLFVYLSSSLPTADRLELLDELLENWLGEQALVELSALALTAERFEQLVAETFAPAEIAGSADLLRRGASRSGRRSIARALGVDEREVLEWVNRVDLMRVKGIGPEYAHLLVLAGVDTVKELRRRNPQRLHRALAATNEETGAVDRLPPEASVAEWVTTAGRIDPVVTH